LPQTCFQQEALADGHDLVQQALRALEDGFDGLIRKVQLVGQSIYADELGEDDGFWRECEREWVSIGEIRGPLRPGPTYPASKRRRALGRRSLEVRVQGMRSYLKMAPVDQTEDSPPPWHRNGRDEPDRDQFEGPWQRRRKRVGPNPITNELSLPQRGIAVGNDSDA
jgi:hypothetical protein